MEEKIFCPLIDGETSDDECYEACLVASRLLRKEAINAEFIQKENFREICLNCPHHNEQME